MARFFKNRFFVILICVAIVLTVVPTVLSLTGNGGLIRNAANAVISPVRHLFVWIGEGFAGYAEYFTEFDRVRDENAELRSQLDALKDRIYDADVKSEENEWLRTFLSLKRENEDFELCDALIIGRESGNYMTVFTLDRGSSSGVEVNMPVVTAEGVVGYITEVGINWSKAATILEYTASVGVYCERSGALGLCEGSYELRTQAKCAVNYLSDDADIKPGDRFVTSGLGGIYPRGLCVGEVIAVYPDNYSRGLVAEITPLVDLSSLSRVMIITGYEDDAPQTEAPEDGGNVE
ncbi:MAG: rod shape-determining protein MreC [Clostridia bacterium]|nr:rod shape-determining protein MreC [Clostridia bacterium]